MAEGIGLLDLASGMNRRGVSIAPESALFIALQITEALRDNPGAFSLAAVRLNGEGSVDVPARGSRDERAALEGVAAVCETLLKPSTAPVRVLLERVRKGEVSGIESLRAEIEALLVPLNRAAAKRVLGRFVREHQRVGADAPSPEAASSAPIPTPAAQPRAPEAGAAPSAIDTSPDAAPPRISPLPAAAAPGKSATDTEPDASAGISAMLAHPLGDEGRVSHANLTNPRIPGPPPLGSLVAIPAQRANADVEPEAYPQDSSRAVKPSAMDTAIDAQVLSSPPPSETSDIEGKLGLQRRSGSSVVLVIAFGSLFVALALLAFALMHR